MFYHERGSKIGKEGSSVRFVKPAERAEPRSTIIKLPNPPSPSSFDTFFVLLIRVLNITREAPVASLSPESKLFKFGVIHSLYQVDSNRPRTRFPLYRTHAPPKCPRKRIMARTKTLPIRSNMTKSNHPPRPTLSKSSSTSVEVKEGIGNAQKQTE